MQTKAYFASSVPAALEVARQELGDDALLIKSRPSPPDMREYGRLEVTFAFEPRINAARNEKPPARGASSQSSDIDDIRRQLADLRSALGRGEKSSVTTLPRSYDHGFTARLIDCGLSRITAAEIVAAAESRAGDPEAAVVAELAARLNSAPYQRDLAEPRTLAFVGPPGRGKTTSLIKTAFHLGLSRRIPVRVYCAGAHAIGAQEQLARYAAILGTPFQSFESFASLNLALNGDNWKGLVLIDTPGIAPADRHELAEMASFFIGRSAIQTHLVLRSDATSADLTSVVTRFSCLSPARLLFTGMDEAQSAASVVETMIRTGIPASFFGTGQHIPDDFEEINPDKLAWEVWSDSLAANREKSDVRVAEAAA